MSFETIDAVSIEVQRLKEFQEAIFSIVLHGGEPLLMGNGRLSYLFASLRNVLPYEYPVSIQTNAILISQDFLEICRKYQVSVAVSIDGPEDINDLYRVGHQGEGTFEKVMRGIRLLQNHPDSEFLNAGLLAVIDPLSDPSIIYNFFKELGAPSVDFLYRDGNHSKLPMGKSSFDSTEYGKWMFGLLKVYLSDVNPLPIRVLDDMLKVLLGGKVSKEGIGITDFGILIIDTDGVLMKNDTLKSSFNGADHFSEAKNIKDLSLLEFINSNEFLSYKMMQRPTSTKCLECASLNVCGGGMILHRWQDEDGFDNPSVYCHDQLFLIKGMKEMLAIMS